jgi:hypothetical protein
MAFWRGARKKLSKLVWLPLSVAPLVGEKLQHVPFLLPPLGSIETYAAGIAAPLVAAFGLLPMFLRTKATAKLHARIGALLALGGLILYGVFLIASVQGVDTPKDGRQFRTIGSERTTEANSMFPDASNEEILRKAGLTDAAIERMWTPNSVRRARIEVFISYLSALALANYTFGSMKRASSQLS